MFSIQCPATGADNFYNIPLAESTCIFVDNIVSSFRNSVQISLKSNYIYLNIPKTCN